MLHRLAHHRARPLQGGHDHQRGELTEVLRAAERAAGRRGPIGHAVLRPEQGHRIVGDLPAAQALPQGAGDVLLHGGGEALHVLVDVERHRLVADVEPEAGARPGRGWLDADAQRSQERVPRRVQDLLGLAGADRPFDADRRGFPEGRPYSVVRGQGGVDDLFLHLAVEREVDFLPPVVLADVDERVLFGQVGQRRVQPRLVARIAGHDSGLQRRRREVVLVHAAGRPPDAVADLDPSQAGQRGDLAGRHLIAALGRAVGEHLDRRHLASGAAAEPHPVPDGDGAREHPGVSDLLPGRPAFDLEHPPRDRAVRVAVRGRQQGTRAAQQRIDAGAGDGRSEVHRVDEHVPDLPGQLLMQPAARYRRRPGEVGGQDRVVVLGQHFREPPGLSAGTKVAARVPSPRTEPIGTMAAVSRSAMQASTRSSLAPRRSILLTKNSVGTRRRCNARHRMRVCGWTPRPPRPPARHRPGR